MTKYYKVIKENFLRDVWAILKEENDYYKPIDDLFIKNDRNAGDWEWYEVITNYIIENQPEYFERVYAVNLITKTVYKVKQEAKELIAKQFKD